VPIAGLLLSASGEGVGHLERCVARIAGAYGLDVATMVLPTRCCSSTDPRSAATSLALVRATPGISRRDRLLDLETLVVDVERGLPAPDAAARAVRLATAPPRWPGLLRAAGVTPFAAGFAPSVVATGGEIAAAAVLGAVMGLFVLASEGRRFEPCCPSSARSSSPSWRPR
jgi:uncharacterized membrane protein YjjP (DUF1212 family)